VTTSRSGSRSCWANTRRSPARTSVRELHGASAAGRYHPAPASTRPPCSARPDSFVPVPPSPHSHRGGSRACRAFDEALGNAGYDSEWIGSAGPESVWSDARAHPGGHDLVRTGRRDADHPLAEHLRVDAPAPSSVEPELIGHVRDAARLQRDRVAPLGCPSGRHNGSGRSRQPGRTYRRRRGGNSRRRRSAPLPNGDRLSLCWSRYLGLALTWGVALCQASSDCDEDA